MTYDDTQAAPVTLGSVAIDPPAAGTTSAALQRFEAELDSTFAALANQLTLLEHQLQDMFERADQLCGPERAHFVATFVIAAAEMGAAFRREMARFSELDLQVAKFGDNISAASKVLVAAATHINEVNRQLRFAGINVRLAVSQVSGSGHSLSAMTHELTTLAAASTQEASRVISITQEVVKRLGAIEHADSALDELARSGQQEANRSLTAIFGVLEAFLRDLLDVIQRRSHMRGAVAHALSAVHRQGALRRGIELVREVLFELERQNAATKGHNAQDGGRDAQLCGYIAAAEQVAGPAAQRLLRFEAKLRELVGELQAVFGSLISNADGLDGRKRELDAGMQERLAAPVVALERLRTLLSKRVAATLRYGTVLSELREPLQTLEELLEKLAALNHTLKNILMLMRIEMPRLRGLENDGSSLIEGVGRCQVQFTRFLEGTEDPIESLRASVADMRRTVRRVERLHGDIAQLSSELQQHSTQIIHAGETFFGHFQELITSSDAMLGAATQGNATLASFDASIAVLSEAHANCARLAAEAARARDALNQQGLFMDGRWAISAELKAAIDRFAVSGDDGEPGVEAAVSDDSSTLPLW